MNRKRMLTLLLAVTLLVSGAGGLARALGEKTGASETVDSTAVAVTLQVNGTGGLAKAQDGKISTFETIPGGATVTVRSDRPMAGLYIQWNKIPGVWAYCLDGTRTCYTAGEKGFLHEYVALPQTAGELSFTAPAGGMQITDLYAFTAGVLPDWVQVWDEPCEKADLVLFSTHSDDEQLFFAGLLPYYAIEVGAQVQVVYMTSHWDTVTRPHEQLNGLWTVGIRHYPIISDFPDDARSLGSLSESQETVLKRTQGVYDEAAWVRFQVQQLRRFRPQVVVDHDFAGEYRHGAHILNSDAMVQALQLSADAGYDPESAAKYGLWDVPKAYFHLYDRNPVVMNYDIPYESMGGRTAFEMSKLGYACHDSQQWTWFTRWVSVDKASQIETYNPCYYGLYRSLVGEDVNKNDLLEHITLYQEQERLAEEQRRQEQKKKTILTLVLIAGLAVVIAALILRNNRRKKRRRRSRRR